MTRSRYRFLVVAIVLIAAVGLFAIATGSYHCVLPGREHRFLCAINLHAGHAHMTRGMNTDTIAALDRVVRDDDIPVLQEMLFSEDHVTAMTSAEVLSRRGTQGRETLMQSYRRAMDARNTVRAQLINEYGNLGQQVYGSPGR